MYFEIIIFDLDGTLIDSQVDVGKALNRLLKDFRINPLDPKIIKTHVGYGVRPLIEKVLKENHIRDIDSAFDTFAKYYLEICTEETPLFDKVADVLIRLSKYQKVILSNKSNRFIRKILCGLGIETYFVKSYGRESFVKSKPDPFPVLSILQEFGVSPSRALIVGDTEMDIVAGQSAGIQTCLVTYGYGNPEPLKNLKPDFTISHFSQILSAVESPKKDT